MRPLLFLVRFVLASLIIASIAVVVILLALIAAQNTQTVAITLLSGTVYIGVGAVLVMAMELGIFLAFALLLPGRLSYAWRSRRLSSNGQRMASELLTLQDRFAQLHAVHQRLLQEHQQLRDRGLAAADGNGNGNEAHPASILVPPSPSPTATPSPPATVLPSVSVTPVTPVTPAPMAPTSRT